MCGLEVDLEVFLSAAIVGVELPPCLLFLLVTMLSLCELVVGGGATPR